ncbi:MAG: hypothetical protein DI623_15180 [Sphingomonas sanxanigenens]|uniref:Uncharacterized protein n=1 Tax=Sphingomonas sanxanigenens TaxID=397260 RepID=A0A2W4ZXY8_9SPHN|nr:MAG: hypothetical protein DI623_15180 [Sphingomonas sanxanigenens]
MGASIAKREKAISASATGLVHALIALALLLSWRAPISGSRHIGDGGLATFDLGRSSFAEDAADDVGGPVDAAPPSLPPPPSVETDNLDQIEPRQPLPGHADMDAGGKTGIAAGGDDPYAYASLRNVASTSRSSTESSPLIGAIASAFERASTGPSGLASITVEVDDHGQVVAARYESGGIGSVRGARLAGYFMGCPVGGPAGERHLALQLPSDADQMSPDQLTIDEKGCHI